LNKGAKELTDLDAKLNTAATGIWEPDKVAAINRIRNWLTKAGKIKDDLTSRSKEENKELDTIDPT